jgi:hypothetical protein
MATPKRYAQSQKAPRSWIERARAALENAEAAL